MYMIKEMPVNERPRERFLKYGRTALSERELIAIILRTGTRSVNVLDMASSVLKRFDSITAINGCSVSDLTTIRGLGPTKAVQILAALELGRRLYEERHLLNRETLDSPKAVYQFMRLHVETKTQENFYCLYLDTKSRLIERVKIYVGTLNSALVHPREVFRHALRLSAASVILIHNHPSGDPAPSESDREITDVLRKNGEMMDIRVVDHIIIGRGRYYSFRENGEY